MGAQAEVTAEWIEAYDDAMANVRATNAALADDLRQFVLTGEPRDSVQRLAAAGAAAGRMSSVRVKSAEVRPVLDGFDRLPLGVAARLAVVWDVTERRPWFTVASMTRVPWLDTLVYVAGYAYGRHKDRHEIPIDLGRLERMTEGAGQPASLLLTAAFSETAKNLRFPRDLWCVRLFRGYSEALQRHPDVPRAFLRGSSVDERLAALKLLEPASDETLVLFLDDLATQATSGSTKVRAAAEPLVKRCGASALQPLRDAILAGKPDARLHGLRLLWDIGDPDTRAWCRERAADDRVSQVRQLLQEWPALGESAPPESHEPEPERPTFDWQEIISAEDRDILVGLDDPGGSVRRSGVEPKVIDQLVTALAAGRPKDLPASRDENSNLYWAWHHAPVKPQLGLAGTVALLHLSRTLAERPSFGVGSLAIPWLDGFHAETGHPTLAELARMLDDLGYDGPKDVLFSWGNGSEWAGTLSERPDAEVAEFTQLHLEVVLDQVAPTEREYGIHKRAAHRALATLPSLPARAVDHLYAVALGPRKVERRAAQDLLNRVPGIAQRILPTLGDSRAELRGEAAAWLGRIADPVALEPLETAFEKEKQDVPLAAMLDALQALGQPVEKYVRPADLADQARKALAKGLPRDLAWFPWAELPPVRWAGGDDVPVEVLQWFLSQAVKGKSPEPNALLRTYASMFEPRGREELGQFVLESWVAEDTRTIDSAVAQRNAEWEAQNLLRYFQNAQPNHPLYGRTHDEIVAAVLPRHLRTVLGSASSSKGVLAVAAACAGERAAPVVQRYLKQFQALRRTQGQALVAMLAWIDHPGATQLMLSVSSRFRSKSIQAEATKQVEALAERKGWSMAELADRSVPVAGLDDDGVLELSYGDRSFTARLLPDLTLELRSPDDKIIKTLPAARVSDDEEAVKEAKKAFSATKRELKDLLALQTERLYEALCTQRTWEYAVWHRYVLGHPVLRHLAARLVWSVSDTDGPVLVRPLGDGTLTDVDDSPVKPGDDATVSLAHESVVSAEVAAAWLSHLADYEVTPLFAQFGKGVFTLAEDQAEQTAVAEFAGTMMESFTLRNHASALGYHRGEVGDAAVFATYEKHYSSLGLAAVINFSGSPVGVENGKVALTELTFERIAGPRGHRRFVALGEVPAVLLSEAWQDMRTVASHGSGQDPNWQTKVDF